MKPRFKGKYRVESTRLPNRDYAANGWYFVTICTRDRAWLFGDVMADEMHLSEIGQVAQQFWAEIPKHVEDVHIDAYVIMPNHVHGIVVIDRPHNVETCHGTSLHGTSLHGTSLHGTSLHGTSLHGTSLHGTSLHQPQTQPIDQSNKFGPLKRGSLQAIMNAYKSSVTRWCRKNGQEHFGWQERFYEHIIRLDGSLDRIREYIINNPAKWEEDKDNPANLWM